MSSGTGKVKRRNRSQAFNIRRCTTKSELGTTHRRTCAVTTCTFITVCGMNTVKSAAVCVEILLDTTVPRHHQPSSTLQLLVCISVCSPLTSRLSRRLPCSSMGKVGKSVIEGASEHKDNKHTGRCRRQALAAFRPSNVERT